MRLFAEDDEGYLKWLRDNPEGWVLNIRARRDPRYVILHRAGCPAISRGDVSDAAWTGRGYRKLCVSLATDLRNACLVAGRPDGTLSRRCGICCRDDLPARKAPMGA